MRNYFLALPLLLAACSQTPSETFNADTSIRIMETLSSDNMQGRRTGTEGAAKAQVFLKKEIAALDIFDKTYDVNFTTKPRPNREGIVAPDAPVYNAVNIHGLIDVDDNDEGPLFVITAHYDHLGMRGDKIYNGADDNASGAAALFAIAQSFAKAAPKHDVLFIWYDAEEMGMQGARHSVKSPKFRDRPIFNLNLDMVSQSQRDEIYASGTYHTPALKPLVVKASKGTDVQVSFGYDRPDSEQDDWTLQSDHVAFHEIGVPHLYFGVEDHPHYHKDTDEFKTIPIEFYKKSLKLLVNTAHTLDENLDDLARPAKG